MSRPIQANINLAALENNLRVVRQLVKNKKIWSVIKANAYGHNITQVWHALKRSDGFALLDLHDAVLLRELGWAGPILLLEGFFQPKDLTIIDHYNLTTVVHSFWQLDTIAKAELRQPVEIYLKINSGMNRLGFSANQFQSAWRAAKENKNIATITLMTHFANADSPYGIDQALSLFNTVSHHVDAPHCLANSAAILWHPSTHGDWVRPGIILYGASPSGHACDIADVGLHPVMTLHSQIIAIQSLSPGHCVGYGGRYCVTSQQRIGIVACGYADGYPRHAPTGTPVLVEGIKVPLVGTVSMDMIAVDLTPCPQAEMGSPVELWGKNLPVDDVASHAGTIGYELLSALTARVNIVSQEY